MLLLTPSSASSKSRFGPSIAGEDMPGRSWRHSTDSVYGKGRAACSSRFSRMTIARSPYIGPWATTCRIAIGIGAATSDTGSRHACASEVAVLTSFGSTPRWGPRRHARGQSGDVFRLDAAGAGDVTLIITGGLRAPADFVKALALGADGIALSNAALQAIGCIGMRACDTNNCPVVIATRREDLRARLPVDEAANRLARFLRASVDLMQVFARACGHRRLAEFSPDDLTTFGREMADLSGVRFSGPDSAARL